MSSSSSTTTILVTSLVVAVVLLIVRAPTSNRLSRRLRILLSLYGKGCVHSLPNLLLTASRFFRPEMMSDFRRTLGDPQVSISIFLPLKLLEVRASYSSSSEFLEENQVQVQIRIPILNLLGGKICVGLTKHKYETRIKLLTTAEDVARAMAVAVVSATTVIYYPCSLLPSVIYS
ncbi:uncharacterized protein LOC111021856 isoform X1 [Momordica charantia]|uniref:Uncharacterized protein LOC111021856 isoform X1 n=1 Tax=Momordica charantia TaxID=3673 RepID=A0A6J1DMR6_MOMCH|nr:uncharacterized protein LOC111021856 isoform X1 [Momordica charantia]